jgi:hypothetical protein
MVVYQQIGSTNTFHGGRLSRPGQDTALAMQIENTTAELPSISAMHVAVALAAARRAGQNAIYRAEPHRIAPYERIARPVIARRAALRSGGAAAAQSTREQGPRPRQPRLLPSVERERPTERHNNGAAWRKHKSPGIASRRRRLHT